MSKLEEHLDRARALLAEQRFEEAATSYESALTLDPSRFGAWLNYANVLLKLSRYSDAIAACERALVLRPGNANALNTQGIAFNALNKPEEALARLDAALAADPNYAKALQNRGQALQMLGRIGEAVASFDRAVALDPSRTEAHYFRGLALAPLGRRDDALASFDAALALSPNDPDILYSKSLALLSFGRWREAWPLFERRWRPRRMRAPPSQDRGEPRWCGDNFGGLLRIWPEQGIGEQILFGRLIPLVLERAPRVALECDARLVPSLRRAFPQLEAVTPVGQAPKAEAQCALGSLGAALDLAPEQVTGEAYLVADPAHQAELRAHYQAAAQGKRVVGISWFSENAQFGRQKSSTLAEWGSLLRQPCHFVNLQYHWQGAEIAAAQEAFGCTIATDLSVDQTRDLEAFAAQIAALDCVVSVSNSSVHMAGALGVPCHVLVGAGQSTLWYWGVEGESTPWYDSVRIHRRTPGASWSEVVAHASAQL